VSRRQLLRIGSALSARRRDRQGYASNNWLRSHAIDLWQAIASGEIRPPSNGKATLPSTELFNLPRRWQRTDNAERRPRDGSGFGPPAATKARAGETVSAWRPSQPSWSCFHMALSTNHMSDKYDGQHQICQFSDHSASRSLLEVERRRILSSPCHGAGRHDRAKTNPRSLRKPQGSHLLQ